MGEVTPYGEIVTGEFLVPKLYRSRLSSERLDEWFNGQVWRLRRGKDVPAALTLREFEGRMRTNASRRGCACTCWEQDGDLFVVRREIGDGAGDRW
jgi:hypothetical protein